MDGNEDENMMDDEDNDGVVSGADAGFSDEEVKQFK